VGSSSKRRLRPCFARDEARAAEPGAEKDLFGSVPGGVMMPSNAGRPRLALRLMISLLYLKHAFNLSDYILEFEPVSLMCPKQQHPLCFR
jgi:hypothetical protein